MKIETAINLQKYPLDRLDSPLGIALTTACQKQLLHSGSCVLPGFLTDSAVQLSLQQGLDSLRQAHQVDHAFAYDDVNDETLATSVDALPQDHPRRYKSLTRIRFIARDLLPENNPVVLIHTWQNMVDFIGRVIGSAPVFPNACPLSSCVMTVAEKDELQDWHFDGVEFIVTIMLQNSVKGGDFEYVPGLRSERDGDDYDRIGRVLQGGRDDVIRLPIEAGTLTLFKGRYNLHRAAPVDDDSRRVMAILSYEKTPDEVGSEAFLKLFYGRSLADL